MKMDSITFYLRQWNKGGRVGKYAFAIPEPMQISEVDMIPYFSEDGEKRVLIRRGTWFQKNHQVRGENGNWETETKWRYEKYDEEVCTPNEANKKYLIAKNTKYATTRRPSEIEGYDISDFLD